MGLPPEQKQSIRYKRPVHGPTARNMTNKAFKLSGLDSNQDKENQNRPIAFLSISTETRRIMLTALNFQRFIRFDD